MSAKSMKVMPGKELHLTDMPIPEEWILEGHPVPQAHITLQSADKKQTTGIWECPAGRFRLEFGWDESSHVLEGEAIIQEEGGATYTVRAGDFVHFPIGLKTTWHVPNRIRKVFFLVTPEPLNL